MVSLPPTRRARSGNLFGRGLFVSALGCLAACAGLLDLPDDPHLAEPEEPAEPARPSTEDLPRPSGSDDEELPAPTSPEIVPGRDVGVDDAPLDPSEQMTSSGGDTSPPNPLGTADAGGDAPPDAAPVEPEPPEPPEPPPPCPTGATLGPRDRCYATITDELVWEEARLACQSIGTGWDLATIRDPIANDFIAALANAEAWLGGSDAAVEGTWRWVSDNQAFYSGTGDDGAAVGGAFENWNSDEPNGAGPSDCMRLVPGPGTWADLQCTFERPAVCEGPAL